MYSAPDFFEVHFDESNTFGSVKCNPATDYRGTDYGDGKLICDYYPIASQTYSYQCYYLSDE